MSIELSNGQTAEHFGGRVFDYARRGFNPLQPRDKNGMWSLTGGKGGRNPQEVKSGKTARGAKGNTKQVAVPRSRRGTVAGNKDADASTLRRRTSTIGDVHKKTGSMKSRRAAAMKRLGVYKA